MALGYMKRLKKKEMRKRATEKSGCGLKLDLLCQLEKRGANLKKKNNTRAYIFRTVFSSFYINSEKKE